MANVMRVVSAPSGAWVNIGTGGVAVQSLRGSFYISQTDDSNPPTSVNVNGESFYPGFIATSGGDEVFLDSNPTSATNWLMSTGNSSAVAVIKNI